MSKNTLNSLESLFLYRYWVLPKYGYSLNKDTFFSIGCRNFFLPDKEFEVKLNGLVNKCSECTFESKMRGYIHLSTQFNFSEEKWTGFTIFQKYFWKIVNPIHFFFLPPFSWRVNS